MYFTRERERERVLMFVICKIPHPNSNNHFSPLKDNRTSFVKVFVNFKVLFKCKALLLIICISYDTICLFCSCLFLIADFPFANIGIYYFVVHFAAFGTIFLELTSDQLSLPICACQNVTVFFKACPRLSLFP